MPSVSGKWEVPSAQAHDKELRFQGSGAKGSLKLDRSEPGAQEFGTQLGELINGLGAIVNSAWVEGSACTPHILGEQTERNNYNLVNRQ